MTDQQQPNGNNSQEVPAPPADTTGADTHAAAAAPSNTSPSRPLLGDLARSAVPSLDVAQAARRTMAVAGAGPSGTSGTSRSGHHKSSSSRRHHYAPAAAASSHQSALRQATASVAPAAVSPPLSASGTGTAAASSALAGLSLGANAAAAAAASPAQPSAAASGMPPRSPPHRAHSAADIGMAPGGEALRRNNSSSAVGGGGGMYQSLRNIETGTSPSNTWAWPAWRTPTQFTPRSTFSRCRCFWRPAPIPRAVQGNSRRPRASWSRIYGSTLQIHIVTRSACSFFPS